LKAHFFNINYYHIYPIANQDQMLSTNFTVFWCKFLIFA